MGVDGIKNQQDSETQPEVRKIPVERLERARKEVDNITDGLNRVIDEGIREGVAVFRALGVETTMSCEGHLDRGSPSPYIDVTAPGEPELIFTGEQEERERIAQKYDVTPEEITTWPRDEERQRRAEAAMGELDAWRGARNHSDIAPETVKWREEESRVQATVQKLLTEFYESRPKPQGGEVILVHDRLRVNSPIFDGYLEAALDNREFPEEERSQLPELLPKYQAEMHAFIEFIKEKFFEKLIK